MPDKLLFLDMDGTVIMNDYSGAFLCRLNGADASAIAETEEAERRGEVDWAGGDALRVTMMRGLDVRKIAENLRDLPIIGGLGEFLAEARRMGYIPVMASAGPDTVARLVAGAHGFETWFASEYGVENGVMTGKITAMITAETKAERVKRIMAQYGADPQKCVAIGDGGSDIGMFAAVGKAIALNAQSHVRRAAAHAVDTEDIRELLRFL